MLVTILVSTPGHARKPRTAAVVTTLFVVSASALQAESERPRVELVPLFCSTGQGRLTTGDACITMIPGKTKVRVGDERAVKTSTWRRGWVCWEKEMLEERPRRKAMLLQVTGLKPKLQSTKPISRRAVEANVGTLRVRDLPGRGCVFTIDLPRLAPAKLK